jgi:type I restriction enzyme, R subunit
VDYDAVNIRSKARMSGVFLKEGENVEIVDPETGLSKMDQLEDERQFETTDLERTVTSPDSNLKIVQEVKRYADEHEQRYGRFPKTLFFAVNDLPHTSHADQLAEIARDVFGKGEAFVEKITGRVDRPLQKIREFRNRPNPGIAITVDLLTTGVDIPDLEFLVFMRPVKSRILFEQMVGRGTRKGEKHPDKDHFTVFDCFDGTLLAYFRNATGITAEALVAPTRTIHEIVEDIWANKDRDYNIGCLVKRFQRIDKAMSGEARQLFAAFVSDGDLAKYARGLPKALRSDFMDAMKLLRLDDFQNLLVTYPRPSRTFMRAYEQTDAVTSTLMLRDANGNEYKPIDYLRAFADYVKQNEAHIEAVRILLSKPRDWKPSALDELRTKLKGSPYRFTEDNLQRAHAAHHKKALVDIISLVQHAADAHRPLFTAVERVEAAFTKITQGHTFTPDQQNWLDRIREHMRENLSIEEEDFDVIPILSNAGGLGAARRVFGVQKLGTLLHELNEAMAA